MLTFCDLQMQWMWPAPLIVGIAFAPESPWWLVRKGREQAALGVLRRLSSRNASTEALHSQLALIRETNDFEQSISEGTSYLDCFKGTNLRRTEIVCVVWLIQTCAGATFMGYSTYFYEAAGLASKNAFSLSLGQYAIGAVGTILSWSLMRYLGRRTLHLFGLLMVSSDLRPYMSVPNLVDR